ncbi:MAG: DUF928 domain-containing protein [Gloeotrichia echinulata GP01]
MFKKNRLYFYLILFAVMFMVISFTMINTSFANSKLIPQNIQTVMLKQVLNLAIKTSDADNSIRLKFDLTKGGRQVNGNRKSRRPYGDSDSKCPPVQVPLTALVPGEGEKAYPIVTAEEHPTFWFYTPYTNASNLSASFDIQDDQSHVSTVKSGDILPSVPGIFSIEITKTLELNKKYYWFFKVKCDTKKTDAEKRVDGEIKRVEKPLLPKSTVEEKVFFYANNGLWNETLTTLIKEVYFSQETRGKLLMKQLLNSVGLDGYDKQQIIK